MVKFNAKKANVKSVIDYIFANKKCLDIVKGVTIE